MIKIGAFDDFLKMLDDNIAEYRNQVDKIIHNAETEDEKLQVEELRKMTYAIENALKNKDVDTLNKIISDASSSNR